MAHEASPPRPDRTVIRPRPGARGAIAGADPFAATTVDDFADVFSGASARAGASRPDPYRGGDPELPLAWAAGENPLINAAHPLLTLVNQIRGTAHHPDPAGLRDELARAVTTFEQAAAAADVPRDTIVGARYLLCTFIDETAAGTPWGGQGAW